MKNFKKEKGITLMALIITIIVLLILAVVTIGAVSDSSIVMHAQNAKSSYEEGQEKEEIGVALNEWTLNKKINPDQTFKEFMESRLKDTAEVSGEDNGPLTITMKKTGNQYIITQDGEITQETKEISDLKKYLFGANGEGRDISKFLGRTRSR